MAKWFSGVGGWLVVLSVAGCSSGASDAGPDSGTPVAKTAQVTSAVAEMNGGAPIAGARICIVDHPEIACATSGADGSYIISLPVWATEVDLAYNVSAAGHLGDTELVHQTPNNAQWGPMPLSLYDDASAADLMNHAGFTYPSGGKGFVLLWSANAMGMISSSPVSAGPVYLDPSGTPDPTLTALTSNGYLLFGTIEPGPIEITSSDPSCVAAAFPVQAWTDPKPATIAGVVVADSITTMALACDAR